MPKGVNQFGKQFVENLYRLKGVKPNDYSFSILSGNKIMKCLGESAVAQW